jgi:hypothetical protein
MLTAAGLSNRTWSRDALDKMISTQKYLISNVKAYMTSSAHVENMNENKYENAEI